MAENDESERFVIIKQATALLEEDFKKLQAEQNVVLAQIAERRKELGDVMATIDAAKLNKDRALVIMADGQAKEESALLARSQSLRIEVMQLESLKAKRETELNATVGELSGQIDMKRVHLASLNRMIAEQESKMSALRDALGTLKSSIMGVSL